MPSKMTAYALAAGMTLLVGCAGYSARPLNGSVDNANAQGIRYYEPAPFLLVYSDGKGNLTSQIIMMPDTSKLMVMDLHAFAAKNNSTLTFDDGVLTSSKFVVDSTAVPAALIDTIKTLGTAAISSAFNAPDSGTTRRIPAPYLFKIVIGRDGTKLVGGQGIGPGGQPLVIQVSVTKEAAAEAAAKPAAGNGSDAEESK
jgi:hypothetical protein